MSERRDIDLIDELLKNEKELPWLELKKNNIEKSVIGKLCSALSNSARLENRDFGYLLWGVDDHTRQIVGTHFDPNSEKIGNQPFQFWFAQQLNPALRLILKLSIIRRDALFYWKFQQQHLRRLLLMIYLTFGLVVLHQNYWIILSIIKN